MRRLFAVTFSVLGICFVLNMYIANMQRSFTPADCERRYTLQEYGGFVACFEQGERLPFFVTKRKVSELPSLDREMLCAGVTVKGARAYTRALEDYTT